MSLSAYVSLYDDASLLGPALAAAAPLVDEIVVVDGAYAWMAPFLAGRDLTRSGPRVEAALAPFHGKLRVLHGTWANEPEKRATGFAACRNRYVLRLDADEVFVPDHAALRRFRDGPHGVGQAPAPTLAAPGWMQAPAGGGPFTPLGVAFDREQVSALDHLAHLWLVMPDVERARIPPSDPAVIAPDPVGFVAHLTTWRLPEDAANRARFYILNYVRETGRLPLLPGFDLARDGFEGLQRTLGPAALDALFRNHPIVTGALDMAGCELRPVPPEVPQERLAPLHAAFLAAHAEASRRLCAEGRLFAQGEPISLDATGPDALPALRPDGTMRVEVSHPLAAARVRAQWLLAAPPWSVDAEGTAVCDGHVAQLALPSEPDGPVLRRIITLQLWLRGAGPFGHFRPLA